MWCHIPDCGDQEILVAGTKDKEKKRLVAQLVHLDSNYAGGLPEYIRNSRKLLKDAQDGELIVLVKTFSQVTIHSD